MAPLNVGEPMRRVIRSACRAVLLLMLVGLGLPAAAPVGAASVNSLNLRATYEVTASFSWATRAVSVHTVAHVANTTANPVSTIAFNLATLKTLGVPYSEEMVQNATADAYGQSAPDSTEAQGVKARYGDAAAVRSFDGNPGTVTEMDALVAYLQVLGKLTNVAHAEPQPGDAQ